VHIYFGVDDLARTRIVAPGGPAAETLFAARLLDHRAGGALFDRWRQVARVRLGSGARAVPVLARTLCMVPELFTDQSPGFRLPESLLSQVDARREQVQRTLQHFCHAAVAPYWQRIRAYLDAERLARGDAMLGGGVEDLLSSLHAWLRWESPVLETPNGVDEVVHLDGRGLLIVPSLFLFDRPMLYATGAGAQPPVLVYPVPFDAATARVLWIHSSPAGKSLGALVGHTRADVLRALHLSHTTTELSRSVGVSLPAISQHTSVLREAGLIVTRRKQNTVWHSLTPLGRALISRTEMEEAHRGEPGTGLVRAFRGSGLLRTPESRSVPDWPARVSRANG
jgi:DNA-binding transcriptional ArsR family regulator